MTTIAPELVAHVKKLVAERGITEAQFTPELAGELLNEASHHFDRLTTELLSRTSPRAQDFWKHFPKVVYIETVARNA